MQNQQEKESEIPPAYERYIRRAASIDEILERLAVLERDAKEQHELNNRLVKILIKTVKGGK